MMWSDNKRKNGIEKENISDPSFAVLPFLLIKMFFMCQPTQNTQPN